MHLSCYSSHMPRCRSLGCLYSHNPAPGSGSSHGHHNLGLSFASPMPEVSGHSSPATAPAPNLDMSEACPAQMTG